MAKSLLKKAIEENVPRFESESHAYFGPLGEMPSVSKLIEPVKAYAGIPEHILIEAAAKGEAAHMAIASWNLSGSDWMASEQDRMHLDRWKAFFSKHPEYEIIGVEVALMHPSMHYAGTIDCIVYDSCCGCVRVIDLKTGSVDGGAAWVAQLSFYTELLRAIVCKPAIGLTVGDPVLVWTGGNKYRTVPEERTLAIGLWQIHRQMTARNGETKWTLI